MDVEPAESQASPRSRDVRQGGARRERRPRGPIDSALVELYLAQLRHRAGWSRPPRTGAVVSRSKR